MEPTSMISWSAARTFPSLFLLHGGLQVENTTYKKTDINSPRRMWITEEIFDSVTERTPRSWDWLQEVLLWRTTASPGYLFRWNNGVHEFWGACKSMMEKWKKDFLLLNQAIKRIAPGRILSAYGGGPAGERRKSNGKFFLPKLNGTEWPTGDKEQVVAALSPWRTRGYPDKLWK